MKYIAMTLSMQEMSFIDATHFLLPATKTTLNWISEKVDFAKKVSETDNEFHHISFRVEGFWIEGIEQFDEIFAVEAHQSTVNETETGEIENAVMMVYHDGDIIFKGYTGDEIAYSEKINFTDVLSIMEKSWKESTQNTKSGS
jgi:hypothetical protein